MGDPFSDLPMLATPKQAADVMGPTEAQVRRLIRDGRIAHVMVGKRPMIPRTAIEDFIAQNTMLPAPSDGRYVCPDRQSATLFSAGAQTTEGEMNADGNDGSLFMQAAHSSRQDSACVYRSAGFRVTPQCRVQP